MNKFILKPLGAFLMPLMLALTLPALAADQTPQAPATPPDAKPKASAHRKAAKTVKTPSAAPHPDKASYYSPKLAGKKMANGKPLDLSSNVAASKTLPLGSTAKVTNLRNGKSATVKIEDRGPYAGDHTLDVTPKTASQLGMKKAGTAPVSIDPVKTP